jgi:excinuclease UvrABC ATPase subunit
VRSIAAGPARCIADVLDLTVSEAMACSSPTSAKSSRDCEPLADVGLDYLRWASPCRRSPVARRSA